MLDKVTQKKLKKIKKEIKKMRKEFKDLELSPCQSDADMRLKDKQIQDFMAIIYSLEKEQDRFFLDSERISHSD